MKTIKIKFVDFWSHWNPNDNFIVDVLKKKYNVVISDKPDYIFFSNFNKKFNHMKYNNCVKIFYTQENIAPDFNYCDYGIGFENMNYGDRYLNYPIYLIPKRYGTSWKLMTKKHLKFQIKEKFCSMVVSNKNRSNILIDTFNLLSKYKKVDSGGRYRNNVGMPNGVPNKIDFQSNYKFSLCFENSKHPGYCTEKIVEGFASKTIPIYWGDPLVKEIFNPDSFIDISDYNNLNELLEYIKYIDNNKEEYKKIINTPALKDKNYYNNKQKELEEFLYNIFEQPIENAKRRNMVFWGVEYHKKYHDQNIAYKILYPFFYIKDLIIRIFNYFK